MTTDTSDISKKALTLRVDTNLHRRIRIQAAKEDKSVTQWINEALLIIVEHEEAKDA